MLLSLFCSNNYCTGEKIEVVKEPLGWVIVAFFVATLPPPPGGE